MDESKHQEKIRNWEHPPWYGPRPSRGEGHVWLSWRIRRIFSTNLMTHFRLPVKQWTTFGPCREASYTAITLNPESHFTRREKESFLHIPLKYIDVTRTTHTNLDVKLEKRIDDYWNIDGSRDLSDPWTGFTQFTLLDEKSSWRIYMVRGEINEKAAYIQARSSMARVMEVNGKERQAEGEAKVGWRKDSSWQCTKNYVESISSTPRIRNLRKPSRTRVRNWKRQFAPAMPCKIMKNCGSGGSDKNKTKTCVYSGSQWIHQNAYGKFWTT